MRAFIKEALVADADIERTAEIYRSEDVHAWMERLSQDATAPRPKPWWR